MHSLIWKQLDSPAYSGMLCLASRNTDPGWIEENFGHNLSFQEVANAIMISMHSSDVPIVVRLCLEDFLERICFHERETNHSHSTYYEETDDDGDDLDIDLITRRTRY